MGEGIYRIFDSVWRLSLVGGYCILLVMLVRILLKKAPKWCSYLLWAIVFVRLCCPILPETGISLIPERLLTVGTVANGTDAAMVGNRADGIALDTQDASMTANSTGDGSNIANGGDTQGATGIGTAAIGGAETIGKGGNASAINGSVGTAGATGDASLADMDPDANGIVDTSANEADDVSAIHAQARPVWFRILTWVWLLGMCGFFGYHVFSYLRMRRCLRRADGSVREVEPGICEIDGGHLSFVMGLVHPVIYLSAGLDPESRRVVLCHEQVHLQRRDYLFKPAALIICCVHWFNPLVWLAFYLMNMDCEMSCDEKVVKLLGEESKKIYSYTLLEEASGGEWKRYRGGSICALLSFGEDHVKSRIRHVLDYRKPSFWIVIGAAVVIVLLIVSLGSNPGGTNGTAAGTETTDTTEPNADAAGETAEPAVDEAYTQLAEEEWLAAFEQGIHSRAEFSALFDVAALDETHSFAGQDGIQYLGYNGVTARKLHRQILDGDTEAHEIYKDPVKAAEALLHLEGGNGYFDERVSEVFNSGWRQYPLYQEDPHRGSEGEVGNIHYTFADGSEIEIPMVMAEESSQIWLLSVGDVSSSTENTAGYSGYRVRPLDGETQARVVYAEYGPTSVDPSSLADMDASVIEYKRVRPGSFADKYVNYQVSSYGIYMADGDGMHCVVPEYIPQGPVPEGWSTVYQDRRYFYTSNQYVQARDYWTEQNNVRLYYLAASGYQDGDIEINIDTIREYDTSGQTGENGVTDWKLSADAQAFYKAAFHAEDGYWIFYNSSRSEQLKLPLLSNRLVWNGKTAADLTPEEANAYAVSQRQDILNNVGVVYDLSERAAQETYALVDLDGDGTAERLTLRSRMAQTTNELDHSPLDQYIFAVNTTRGETQTAQNLSNCIYAFSPDGRQILLVLTRKDEWDEYESLLFRYENGELQEAGSFAQDIRKIWVENGQIITEQNYNYTLQTEKIRIAYRIGSNGMLEEVPADRYELPDRDTLHWLNREIEVYETPDSGRFTIPVEHSVYLRCLDSTRQWLLVETENGVTGWLRLADYTAEETWATFQGIMPKGG